MQDVRLQLKSTKRKTPKKKDRIHELYAERSSARMEWEERIRKSWNWKWREK